MDAATLDPELLDGFFLDVDETFSPEIARAMDLAREGDITASVDMMLRPLHTIKGTSAFLGLEEISDYAHAVEDHLKALQAGTVPRDGDFLLRCVDMVFHLLERARRGESLSQTGHRELARDIRHGGPAQQGDGGSGVFDLQQRKGVTVFKVRVQRLHLPNQYAPLLQALSQQPAGSEVLLDLSCVRTINSTTWGGLWLAAGRLSLHATGLSGACQSTFASWGFAARITVHESMEQFWLQHTAE